MTRGVTLISLIAGLASAQPLEFEVASVRLAERGCAPSHNVTPTQVTYSCTFLSDVISEAYGIPLYRTEGFGKTGSIFVNIAATMPAGTTKQQIPAMLQNFLAERFQLKVHREVREGNTFELTVEKSGHKLHENTSNPEPADPDAQYPLGKPDGYGLPELPNVPGHVRFFVIPGKARAKGYAAPLSELIKTLEPFLKGPISDHTGLTGKYNFTLDFEGPEYNVVLPDGNIHPTTAVEFFPPIPNAMSKQLGLHLERTKLPVEFLVLDSMSLTPTPN
jgi:uncharacterized protein (TIGR03435 family)